MFSNFTLTYLPDC